MNTFELKCIFFKGLHYICLSKKDTKVWALKWLILAWIWIWLMITDGKMRSTYKVWNNYMIVIMWYFVYRSPLHISIDKGFEDLSIHLIESGAKWDIEFPGGRWLSIIIVYNFILQLSKFLIKVYPSRGNQQTFSWFGLPFDWFRSKCGPSGF